MQQTIFTARRADDDLFHSSHFSKQCRHQHTAGINRGPTWDIDAHALEGTDVLAGCRSIIGLPPACAFLLFVKGDDIGSGGLYRAAGSFLHLTTCAIPLLRSDLQRFERGTIESPPQR